jgi:pyridoxine kinase
MGDQGRLYVSEDVVPVYKELITHADLILPNQFEAETLSGLTIAGVEGLKSAVERLHGVYGVPHVVVTSLSFEGESDHDDTIAVAGSSRTTTGTSRLFILRVPKLNCYFSGTGDMFAALMVVRMREAGLEAGLDDVKGWMSGDEVGATELPLARAVEKVLAGMGGVLQETMLGRWGLGRRRIRVERERRSGRGGIWRRRRPRR